MSERACLSALVAAGHPPAQGMGMSLLPERFFSDCARQLLKSGSYTDREGTTARGSLR